MGTCFAHREGVIAETAFLPGVELSAGAGVLAEGLDGTRYVEC